MGMNRPVARIMRMQIKCRIDRLNAEIMEVLKFGRRVWKHQGGMRPERGAHGAQGEKNTGGRPEGPSVPYDGIERAAPWCFPSGPGASNRRNRRNRGGGGMSDSEASASRGVEKGIAQASFKENAT
ncbi:hypothetical protein Sfum_3935 [Syntrophobacter fumaroxidans MPOB]|uniref:Uncharacterized protein n=1 Tax=Syntrophobacter fumaroxidans (strain DSM 10017 / MPOB) TaxID=335543 RepID=A0LQA2_SYNFM|nr:hypothetical protein Sfum_3935 [Syntrophobacter fumaroxidans MPOB]